MQALSTEQEAIAAFQRGDLERARSLAQLQLVRAESAQLLHLMGLIECRAGRLEDGIEWLRRASNAEPGNIDFRVMLARALVDARRPGEALAVAPPPVGTSPAERALWYARAEAADAAGDGKASAEAWSIICSFAPRDWRAWASRANAHASRAEWHDAVAAFRRAVEINPREESIRRNLAAALKQDGKKQEALAEMDLLVRRAPTSAGLRFERAQMLDDLGKPAEALNEFEETARLLVASAAGDDGLIGLASSDGKTDMGVLRSLALLFERTNRMDSLTKLVEQAGQRGILLAYAAAVIALQQGKPEEARQLLLREEPQLDPGRWHELMAKIGEALDDPALAFGEAEAMNRSVENFDEWRSRGAVYREHVRTLEQTITKDWLAPVPRLPRSSRPSPAFLVGFPRSGTTLLDTFLMGHPEIRVLEEVPMLTAAEKTFGAMVQLPQCSEVQLEAARSGYWEECDRHVPPDFSGLLVDKLPMNMLGLPLIHSMFPDARVIFAQRHPVDVVLSGFMQNFVLNDTMASFLNIHDAADLYDAVMSVFARARDLVPLTYHTSLYEQLILNPEQSLRPLIEFLGLDWREDLLNHQRTARERGAIVTPSYNQVTEPLTTKASGRWRRYEKQLEPVLTVLLPWAERLGYVD